MDNKIRTYDIGSLPLVAFPFIDKPTESFIALAAISSGLPAYFLLVHKEASHPGYTVSGISVMLLLRVYNVE